MSALLARFLRHVDVDGPVPAENPELGSCWLWTGSAGHSGYGIFHVEREPDFNQKTISAHRVPFLVLFGPIPAGLEPDHICEVRLCVNPFHLRLLTHRENVRLNSSPLALNAKKTHCPKGHPYDEENTAIVKSGRKCKACDRERHAAADQDAINKRRRERYAAKRREALV